MNEALIENWNKTVNENDRVFFLGDFALGSREDVVRFGKQIVLRDTMTGRDKIHLI